jgi:hypothetical protein
MPAIEPESGPRQERPFQGGVDRKLASSMRRPRKTVLRLIGNQHLKPVAETFDQVHPLMKHGNDDNG